MPEAPSNMPLQLAIPPQGHGVESSGRRGGGLAAERQGVRQITMTDDSPKSDMIALSELLRAPRLAAQPHLREPPGADPHAGWCGRGP